MSSGGQKQSLLSLVCCALEEKEKPQKKRHRSHVATLASHVSAACGDFSVMDNIKDGWFTETCTLWPGQAMTLQVEEVLYNKKSKFQDVLVFKRCLNSTWMQC